jgi:hypothetical protein
VPGPGAAAGAKAASSAAGRVSAGAASRSGTAQAAKQGGTAAASRSAGASRSGGGGAGRGSRGGGGNGGQARSLGRVASIRMRRERDREDDQALFGSAAFRLIAIGGGVLAFFVLVIVAPLTLFEAAASSCGGEEDEAVPIQTNHRSDPEDLSQTQIEIRIYLVGQVMKMTPRQIVTAYDVAYVESTMTNIHGGDSDSTGVFQQRNFSPWTDGGRNRNNVIDASISFFLQLRRLDRGQAIPVLAQDVQVSAYPERYFEWVDDGVNTYNRIHRLIGSAAGVKSIESLQGVTIGGGGLDSLSLGAACSGLTATGPANVKRAVTVYQPRSYKTLPANLWAGGGEPEQVDTRIWEDAVWVMSTYHLKATASRETGHHTHGDGTAIDMAPAEGNSQQTWDSTARRLALDLGWTPGCAANGLNTSAGGLCNLVPAIIFVGYNGYDSNHGDPQHSSSPHVHVSWYSSCYGCGGGALVPPRAWVKVFPVGPGAGTASPVSTRTARQGARA